MFEFFKKIFAKKCPYCGSKELTENARGFYCRICNINWSKIEVN